MTVIETLLRDLPNDCRVTDVYIGANWVLSLVNNSDAAQSAGVASTPKQIATPSRFQIGHYPLHENAQSVAHLLRSQDAATAAVGLATVNALHQPSDTMLRLADAADWLSANCTNRTIAVFGRFPFLDVEIRPNARQMWVFEQEPQAGEMDTTAMTAILPQADIVAITGSTVINHTIDEILTHVSPNSVVVLLGPSTPLSTSLFHCGIDAMFGVRVVDIQEVTASVIGGEGFQKMQGLQRVALFRDHSSKS